MSVDLTIRRWIYTHGGRKMAVVCAGLDAAEARRIELISDGWVLLTKTPHAGGDFSYMCGFKHCRCMSTAAENRKRSPW